MEDLQVVEHIVQLDPKVIEQCAISGIPKEDMHKVYCDRMLYQRIGHVLPLLTKTQPGRLGSMKDLAIK